MGMDEFKWAFFFIGTVAFMVVLYLAIKHPEFEEGPLVEHREVISHPLKKYDQAAYWTMWVAWGLTGVLFYWDKHKLGEYLF